MLAKLKCRVAASVLSIACLASTSDPRLAEAAKHQNKEAVRALLAEHIDVNAASEDGATALQWAAHWNDFDTADLLIRAGARVDSTNELGVTPLSLACVNGSSAMVEKLVTAGASVNLALPTGETPLMTCARAGSAKAVEALLSRGANVNAKENLGDQTALMWAVSERHPEVTRVLIARGADVRAQSRVFGEVMIRDDTGARLVCPPPAGINAACSNTDVIQKGGSTALFFAARSGDLESAKLLVAAGANVNDMAPDGNSVLVVAAYSGNEELAEFLLDKDAGPNAAGGGYTAMHAAVLRSELGLVKTLLAHGANPNGRITKGTPVRRSAQDYVLPESFVGATAFFLAARFVEPDIMRVLAAANADPSLAVKNGTTPLMAAAGIGRKAGETRRNTAFPMVPPPDDDRALDAAKIAFSLGADVNAVNESGDTALHGAASEGYRDIVQLLVDKGAKLDARNKKGQTPLAMTSADFLSAGGAYGVRDHKAARALLIRLGATEDPPRNADPKNLQILKDASAIRPTMTSFTSGLGVQCAFCHAQDRASDENPHKLTARKMMLMVSEINAKFPDGRAHVSCYTCHRGENVPQTSAPATAH
jgi:uncharacterized protein